MALGRATALGHADASPSRHAAALWRHLGSAGRCRLYTRWTRSVQLVARATRSSNE